MKIFSADNPKITNTSFENTFNVQNLLKPVQMRISEWQILELVSKNS